MGKSILCFRGIHVQVNFFNYGVFMSLKFVFILPNSTGPDQMLHYAARKYVSLPIEQKITPSSLTV